VLLRVSPIRKIPRVNAAYEVSSSGVGQISQSLADDVIAALFARSRNGGATPTAFQLRIGGSKGDQMSFIELVPELTHGSQVWCSSTRFY